MQFYFFISAFGWLVSDIFQEVTMQQLNLLGFSQPTLTDYGPVTVASSATNGDSACQIATNSDASAAWPVVIRWPAGSQVGCIHGQFTRLDSGEIEATYQDAFELRNCLRFLAWSKGLDFEQLFRSKR